MRDASGRYARPHLDPPAPLANGGYVLATIAAFFDLKVTPVGSVTVLAPDTMRVLNYKNLPPPNLYAGLSAAQKARLLESMFTPEQWHLLAGANGIGAGDLTEEQLAIYLSLLPDPFTLYPAPSGSQSPDADPPQPITLTADQRASVRLSLRKQLNWSLRQGTNGTVSFGSQAPPTEIGGIGYRLAPGASTSGEQDSGLFYGAYLVSDRANASKPGNLAYANPAFDAPVKTDGAGTIGALVNKIGAVTGAKLYADPRYAALTVCARGSSARAGDLLHALSWAVTGTWRKVGDSYVLTDDLEGLGARHALMADWVTQGALLSDMLKNNVQDALDSSHGFDLAAWSDTDPYRPSDTLIAKLSAPAPPVQGEAPSGANALPFVPVTELPAALQVEIQQ